VSWYQKVHFAIFLIFWCKMKITQADTPTIRMDCHPSKLIGAPISAIPTIFTQDALPDTTLPIYPGLRHASNMLAYIPSGLVPFARTQARICRLYSPVAKSTTLCCTSEQTTLRRCCSCSFRYYIHISKWSSFILLW